VGARVRYARRARGARLEVPVWRCLTPARRNRASRCRAVWFHAAIFLALFAAGCGAKPLGSPKEIINRAITAQGSLKSVRMELDSKTDINVPGAVRSDEVFYTGVYQKPDRWQLNIRSSGTKTEAIILGGRTFVKLPGSDSWTEKKDDVLDSGASPDKLVSGKYLKSATNTVLVDRKGDNYHLKFDLDMSKYVKAVNSTGVDPAAFAGKSAAMEVWVLKGSTYISKATMRYSSDVPGVDSSKLGLSMEVDFSEFNEPVKIEAPK
jgi:hypothetical protein